MGYELKLFAGKSGHSSREFKCSEVGEIEGSDVYFPALKDENGKYIETGRTAIYFRVYAMLDLCKPGYESNIIKVDWRNKTKDSVYWYHYGAHGGNRETRDDSYGDYSRPVPVAEVIAALEKDAAADDYHRFSWALAALKAMPADTEVLFYGY
jgi:hypothetical protein